MARTYWRDRLAKLLLRWGLYVASNRHALWHWQEQTIWWNSEEGRALRRRLAGE